MVKSERGESDSFTEYGERDGRKWWTQQQFASYTSLYQHSPPPLPMNPFSVKITNAADDNAGKDGMSKTKWAAEVSTAHPADREPTFLQVLQGP